MATGKGTVGTSELAGILGISRQRINELGRKGKLVRESDGRWDVEKVRVALAQNLDARQVSPAKGQAAPKTVGKKPTAAEAKLVESKEPPHGSLAWEQLQHEREKRLKTALERQRLEGSLVDLEETKAKWTEIGVKFRDSVMGLPSRAINRLPGEWRREVFAVLDDEVRRILVTLSDEIGLDSKAA